jgi:preprotein translocase subunit SecA
MSGRREPSIVIVDTFTGRPMIGRQWSDGLHQAVEAKESVPIKQETQTIATVTIQNFFKMYKRLAGMTGTADTEAQEFHDIYKLDVVSIPTNKPVIRSDYDDLMFLRAKDKWEAIVDEIKAFHDAGRPSSSAPPASRRARCWRRCSPASTRSSTTCSTPSSTSARPASSRVPATARRGHDRDEHGRARHGHQAGLGHARAAPRPLAQAEHRLTGPDCRRHRRGAARERLPQDRPGRTRHPKREAESMDFAELELRLLRHWANRNTWVSPKRIESMDAESCARRSTRPGAACSTASGGSRLSRTWAACT